MQEYESVKVYNFWTYERGAELPPLAPFKATREAIAQVWQGRLADGTEQVVNASDLDRLGRYRRLPTGWGDLS